MMPFLSKPPVFPSNLSKGMVALPGGGTAVYNAAGLSYIRHKDWLGSTRLATTWAHQVYAKEGYAPFGESYNEAGTADRSFTGQDQDSVSGVFDDFFRKQDPTSGRWLSPDPAGWDSATLEFPQTLNRYAYVVNNPMSLTDPNGLDCAEQSWNNIAFAYCYVQDASYNGPPPSDILPPPSFTDSTQTSVYSSVLGQNVTVTDTTKEGCSGPQGLQNGATGCGYQFGGELSSIPNWYNVEAGGGQFTKDALSGGYNYSPQYNPFIVNAISNIIGSTMQTVADIGGYSAATGVFQVETSPFFSQQQPPPPTNHGKFCHVTSKPGSVALTYSCNSF